MNRKYTLKTGIMAVALVLVLLSSMMLTSCTGSETSVTAADNPGQTVTGTQEISSDAVITAEYDKDDMKTNFSESEISTVVFSEDSIESSGANAFVSGNVITIIASGTYSLCGNMDDGQVVVDSQDEGTVFLILDNLELSSSNSAPIYIANAEKTVITLAEGTENTLSDSTERIFADIEDEEPNSVLFSEDDLTINGSGTLIINANYKHGINSKDDLIIISGNIVVNAVSDGIRGRDSITVSGGTITINTENDGMQSNNDDDPEKGYILIEGGTLDIVCKNDGIQAETNVIINAGVINITAGGGTQNIVVSMSVSEQEKDRLVIVEETESTKGIKAGKLLLVTEGEITVDSHDDALHSNNMLTISSGVLTLSTDDDGIHADSQIIIDGGYIDVINCNEGIESMVIVVNDGYIRLNASDDGINASDGTASTMMPRFEVATDGVGIFVNGGYIYVSSNGDSVDSNGSIEMTGGTVVANGPQSPTNGTLDSDGEFTISGGLLVAAGSSGMAEAPGTASEQYVLLYNYDTVRSAGTMIYIVSQDGEQILAFEPSKEYQSIVLSSPDLTKGETYTIYSGGSMNSIETDGLYETGTYTKGTEVYSFTVSSIVTTVGEQSRQGGMTPGGIMPGGVVPGGGKRP
jgi:hypothetical protein